MKNRFLNRALCAVLAAAMICGSPAAVFASQETELSTESETEETAGAAAEAEKQEEEIEEVKKEDLGVEQVGDKVTITAKDKPYLSLGANLSADQKAIVLSLMGISPADLDNYNVSYVTNEEEHKYLDAYVDSSAIGSRSLSSVVITEGKEGSGLNISTYNINYCTVGMYKNALITAGVTDANIIVAGPSPISGTAALVGVIKAYEEMTGENVEEKIIDAAIDELVTTGELAEALDGVDSETIETVIAELKELLAQGKLETEESIRNAIAEMEEKYSFYLDESEIQQIISLLNKLKGLDLDWDKLASQASRLVKNLTSGETMGFLSQIGSSARNLIDAVIGFFQGLFK